MKRSITAITAILTILLALLCFSLSAQAAKNIAVAFEYPGIAESYKLYMDGQVICTDVQAGTMTCNEITIDYGVHQFTMTAVAAGVESLHSPAYVWSYAPVPGVAPKFLNISVTIEDGSVIPLGAVKIE